MRFLFASRFLFACLSSRSDLGTNDHYVLDQKGLGQKGLEKSHVNVNVVIGYVVVWIVRSCEKCRAIDRDSNCVNLPNRYRNKLRKNKY